MRFNFDHLVYSYYNNKLLTTLEKIHDPKMQEGPLILYDARHVHELASLIRSEVNDDLDDRSRYDRQVHHNSTDLKHLSRYMRTHDHFMTSGMIISMVA